MSLAWEIGISEDPRGGAADLIHLLMRQVSVLVGTGALMMVIQRALGRGWEGLERRPKIVGVMVQERYYRELMRRHWWAVLGAGTVFGVAGGTGPVLLLAVELTLMWAGCRMIMAFTKRPE